ncbi:hypothetical protein [Acinetobacter sp. ANC 4779]|nr:hypothetical protein [Acinetobacter sp. ANC 4779]
MMHQAEACTDISAIYSLNDKCYSSDKKSLLR